MDKKIQVYSSAKDVVEGAHIHSYGNVLYAHDGHCYKPCDDTTLNRIVFEIGFKDNPDSANPKIITDIARLIKMLPEINRELKPDNYTWVFNNAAVDPMTEKTHQLSYDIFSPGCINAKYMPSVSNTTNFDIFLQAITNSDEQLAERFIQAIGFIVSPDLNPGKFVYIQSKSSAVRNLTGSLFRSFFYEDMISGIDIYDMDNRFSVFELCGKKLNINMSISSGIINAKNIRILKQITDTQNKFLTERSYHNTYKTLNSCKLIFGSEFQLQPNTYDSDFQNRILYLPLTDTPDKRILSDDFEKNLLSEKSSIIRKAMEGYRKLRNNGYRFTGQNEYTMEFGNNGMLRISDILPMFVDECIELAEEGYIFSFELEESFKKYCRESNIFIPVTKARLSSALKKYLGNAVISQKRRLQEEKNSLNGFSGIKFRDGNCR